ncbi:MAG TPA: hypothetical protein VF329_05110 [Gammaproteobacteria bacterium]
MATKQPRKPATIDDRLAGIMAAMRANEADTHAAVAAVAADPSDDRALKQLEALRAERAKMETQREALELVRAKQREQDVQRSDAEHAKHVQQLVDQLNELLAKRVEVVQQIASAFDALAAPLAAYDLLAQDIRGAVVGLSRATGRRVSHLPTVEARATEESLLASLYRTGLGRTGPRMHDRVSVDPFVDSSKARPIAEAIQADNERLLSNVSKFFDAVPDERTPWFAPMKEVEAARREHEHAESEAAAKSLKADVAKGRERAERRAKVKPVGRDGQGNIVPAKSEVDQ